MRYCDANGKASQRALADMIKHASAKGRKQRAATLETNELSDAFPTSQRNLLLANSPSEQYMRGAIHNSARNSPHLNFRSMLNGSNAKMLEGRFAVMKNSPSGKYLCHPGSRFPDELNRAPPIGAIDPSRGVYPSNSVASLISANEYIPSFPASVDSK